MLDSKLPGYLKPWILGWADQVRAWLLSVKDTPMKAPHKHERYMRNDIGAGYLFSDMAAGVVCYVPERRQWFYYYGGVWQPDEGALVTMELCKWLYWTLSDYARTLPDEDSENYLKFLNRWQTRRYRRTVIDDATSVNPVYASVFDNDPLLFNCKNGTLNLETFEFYDHRPTDYLTKMAPVTFDPAARSALWENTVDQVMLGDKEEARYLQKAFGYGLTGETLYECLFVLFGATSRNGKGTLTDTYLHVVGDYGQTTRPETIALRKTPSSGSAPSEDVARLAGARVVNISEPGKDLALNAALVKTLTGNDKIVARYLHENSFEFYPQFKFFINTNYLPRVDDPTIFLSGRVKVIPFNRHFSEKEQDKTLKKKLAKPKELSGVLNWCLDGLRMLRREGLEPPESVKAATAQYQHDSDKIARFIEDTMEPDPFGFVPLDLAYIKYQTWCGQNGYHAENYRNFKIALEQRNIQTGKKRPPGAGQEAPKASIIGFQWLPVPGVPENLVPPHEQ